jgi:hypothetical protein
MSPPKADGQTVGLFGLICRFLNLFPIGFPTVFWISYFSDRRSSKQLDTDFEHFVAPNKVIGSPLGFIPVGA